MIELDEDHRTQDAVVERAYMDPAGIRYDELSAEGRERLEAPPATYGCPRSRSAVGPPGQTLAGHAYKAGPAAQRLTENELSYFS